MWYELVANDARDERGPMYLNATTAVREAVHGFEVWGVAQDEAQTRVVRVWPPSEVPPPDEVRAKRIERTSDDYTGLANREATAMISTSGYAPTDRLHALVAEAWLKGVMHGYGECLVMVDPSEPDPGEQAGA